VIVALTGCQFLNWNQRSQLRGWAIGRKARTILPEITEAILDRFLVFGGYRFRPDFRLVRCAPLIAS